jgi:hypothetical protein
MMNEKIKLSVSNTWAPTTNVSGTRLDDITFSFPRVKTRPTPRRRNSQSHTVDYKAMPKQNKHFFFRKRFRKAFSPSPKSDQSIRELRQL